MGLTKRQRYYFLIYLLVFGSISLYHYFHYRNQSEITYSQYTTKYEVTYRYIMDGDTAVFFMEDEDVTVRFLAIDTPEQGEDGSEEARIFTDKALRNAKQILLELDPASDTYDRYDRLLAWVWIDGELLQAKLLENHLAEIRYLYADYLYTDYLYKISN